MMKKTQNKIAEAVEEKVAEQDASQQESTTAQQEAVNTKSGTIYIGLLDGPKTTKGWYSNEPLLAEDRQWRIVGEAESINAAIGKMLSDFHFWFIATEGESESIEAHFRSGVLQLALANQKHGTNA